MTWSYIAGFFDGEGSIGHNGKGFRVTIPQTNEQVLQELKKFSKMGNVIATAKRKAHWKDNWVYYVARQEDVQVFLRRVLPHLIVKRSAVEQAIKKIAPLLVVQKQRATLAKHRREEVKILREKGLSYRVIGRKVGIDWGYARRLYLGKN